MYERISWSSASAVDTLCVHKKKMLSRWVPSGIGIMPALITHTLTILASICTYCCCPLLNGKRCWNQRPLLPSVLVVNKSFSGATPTRKLSARTDNLLSARVVSGSVTPWCGTCLEKARRGGHLLVAAPLAACLFWTTDLSIFIS